MLKNILVATAAFTLFSGMARAEETLPNVLIIGDSISIGYTKPLQKILAKEARVVHHDGNAGPSSNGIAKLDAWLGDTKWAVIHFNHGLHDLKFVDANKQNVKSADAGSIQVPLDAYVKNMQQIATRLQKTGATVIFATTTPYDGEMANPLRQAGMPAKYNEAVLPVMKKLSIPVNDLHAFSLPKLKEIQRPKNVHFTPKGSTVLAEEVARHIRAALDSK